MSTHPSPRNLLAQKACLRAIAVVGRVRDPAHLVNDIGGWPKTSHCDAKGVQFEHTSSHRYWRIFTQRLAKPLSLSPVYVDDFAQLQTPDYTMADPKQHVFALSPIDMLMPRMHVPKLLYFASTAKPATVLSNLQAALALTIKNIPILAGSVSFSKREEDQKGSLSVQSPYFIAEDIISSNDLRNEYDYEQLRAADFPTNGIAFDAIAGNLFGKAADSAPVMIAQANFLRGGLLLFFAVHHCVFDEMGLFNVMKVWAAHCRGDIDANFVGPQWFERTPLMQGAGTGRLEDHPEYGLSPEGAIVRPTEDPSAFYPISENVDSAVFFLSDESLARLKSAATMPVPDIAEGKADIAKISTNDALTALFWCCITSARIADSTNSPEKIVARFAMAMNGRSHLRPPMPPDYCGNVVLIAKTASRANDLLSIQRTCLTKASLLVRKSLNVVDDPYIRDVIQMVSNVDDMGRLASRRRPAIEHSLGCSTWARQPYYSLDWGSTIGGVCERVRWRRLKTDGLFIIFPRLQNTDTSRNKSGGGVEVQLGLRSDHLRTLMKDPLFTEFAQWRCN